jgi:CHAD domain-containing protein
LPPLIPTAEFLSSVMAKAKKIEGLNCEASAADNIRLVLVGRLDEMCELRAEALDCSDPKGVHAMRVASRRLRSAVQDFKPYLRRRKLAAAVGELKRIARALGAVRDMDVAIMALEELEAEAPAANKEGVAALALERRAERETAHAALVKAIEAEKLEDLRAEFADALERALKPGRGGAKKKRHAASLSFGEVAPEVVRARLEELRELSACLYQPFAVDALHRMRIAAKRLRYAMQLFATCLNEALAEHAAEVAELQTSLGKLHDCDVWLEVLGRMLRDFRKHEDAAGSPLSDAEQQQRMAAVWLLRHFAGARMKHYGHALACWHEWQRNRFSARLIKALETSTPTVVELSAVALTASEAVAADIEAREPS